MNVNETLIWESHTRYALKKNSQNEVQLLSDMVLGLEEEVSWCSVSSVIEDWERNPFGDVKDRSLSYLDIHFREQFYCGKSKVFESVRKFGRPRQQISEVLSFAIDGGQGQEAKDSRKRYHFGQCLILPKVSTLPPKGNVNRRKSVGRRTLKTKRRLPGNEETVMFARHKTVNRSGDKDIGEFENKMYRWSETLPDNYPKRSSRKTSIEELEDASLRSGGRTGNHKEFPDYYEEDQEDIEAQLEVRYKRDVGNNQDDYYYHNTLEARQSRHSRDVDEITNPETRISDIRENWRLKVLKEMEAKQMKGKSNVDLSKHRSKENLKDDIAWEKSSERRTWVGEEEEIEDRGKKELHRSKSTPDMLEGITKRKLEVWPTEDKPKKNGSMMEVYPRHWSVYNDQQEADSLNEPNSLQEPVSSPEYPGVGGKSRNSRFATGKSFFGQFLNSGGTTPTPEMFNSEPFSQFWVTLSNVYGQALVILMFAFSLTEVMDNSVKLLSLQGIFLMYLYVGSIAVIICIYIWVLIDSCSSMQTNDGAGLVPPTITTSVVPDRDSDLRNLSPTKFGSLKKAHITRDRTSSTSFYLRIGAIAFGLGTLVFNGLEMAMHSMMEGSCLNDVVFVHPILQGLFTFLQMHFLFVNSQVLVERFGLAARFGFMHLAATNLALWIRLVIWESGNEWTYYVHLSQTLGNGPSSEVPTPLQLRGFPKYIVRKEREVDYGPVDNSVYRAVSTDHISQVVSLHQCLNTNSLGQLWTSSMPFLYPFLIQFSLIAAAVTYIMGQNVAKDRLFFQKQKKVSESKSSSLPTLPDNINVWGIDCSGASKGLFLGILCLVAGVVVIIIFLVVKENEDFPPETIFWLTSGTLITILSITIVMNVVGLIQIRKLSVIGTKMTPLDKILSVVSMLGVQLFTILGMVVGGSGIGTEDESSVQKRHGMLLAVSIIQLIQAILQSSFVVEGIRRTCLSRTQAITKPARQVITFLIFSNAVLWAFDTFVVQSWISQELQLQFFGILAWGVVSRIGLPLFVFFRFHSCVLLLEIWKRSYHSLHLDPGN